MEGERRREKRKGREERGKEGMGGEEGRAWEGNGEEERTERDQSDSLPVP